MNNTIVGYVNRLGYLYCVACYANHEHDDSDRPVCADTGPHNAEPCDDCARVLVRNWYVIPYVITDEDDYSRGHVAIVAAASSNDAQKRMEELARDGDAALWGEGIAKAYEGSRFDRVDPGVYSNARPCDCGDTGCHDENSTHETLSVLARWDPNDGKAFATKEEAESHAAAAHPGRAVEVVNAE